MPHNTTLTTSASSATIPPEKSSVTQSHSSSPEDATPSTVDHPLYVNDGPLAPSETTFLRPSSLSLPLSELRARFASDGYLFLKGLLPRSKVLKAREEYFRFLSPSGVLSPETAPIDGIYDSTKDISQFPGIGAGAAGKNGHPGAQAAKFVDLALAAHAQPWYTDDLCKMPELHDFMARFTGWEDNTLGFKRTLLRNNIPGAKAIGVHYDQIFLRHGEDTSVTVWVPMGDVALDGGGLIYLEGGHEVGKKFEEEFEEKAKAAGLTEEEKRSAFNRNMMDTGLLAEGPAEFGRSYGRRWLCTGYEAGDVVLHSPYMVSLQL